MRLRALSSDAVVTAAGPRNLTREHLAG